MAHNLTLFDHFHPGEIGRIDFFHQQREGAKPHYGSVSRLPGGIRLRTGEGDIGEGGFVDVKGEDLFALREMLAEIPEETFVRPADPVEEPPFWSDGDLVEFVGSWFIESLFRREADGTWIRVWSNQPNRIGPACDMDDTVMTLRVTGGVPQYRVLRRANA